MKYVIVLTLFLSNAFAAELILNRYEESNQSVDVYHVVDDRPIECSVAYENMFKKLIKCKFSRQIKTDHDRRDETYFKIEIKDTEILFHSKEYAKLLPVNDKIKNRQTIEKPAFYRHWMIVGSKRKPKILDERAKKVFNFPLKFKKTPMPYIGALDLNGEPIKNKKDAITLSQIKRLFKQKKYDRIIKLCDALEESRDNDFTSEIGLYKLRSLAKIAPDNREYYFDLKNAALEWINDNPSNRHIPEAYMYAATGSFGLGRVKNGEKYLKILIDGFPKNRFTYLARLSYADRLYKTKKSAPRAVKIYKEVLYETDDVNTASIASLRLAKAYLDKKEPKKAQLIFDKVLKSNRSFIKENKQSSYALAEKFADYDKYDIALRILKTLREDTNKVEDEQLLKTQAHWERLAGEIDNAMRDYSRYIKTYPQGKYAEFAKKELDSILITKTDTNLTKKLAFIDEILKKYDDKTIREKALEEKMKVLIKLKKYDEILAIKSDIDNRSQKYMKEAARQIVLQSLRERKCEKAIKVSKEYNITVSADYDEEKFDCLVKIGKYEKALKIAQEYMKTNDLKEKIKWLYLSSKLYAKTGENKKVILSANDVLKLSKLIGINRYDDVLYDMADAYYNLKEYDDLMLKSVQEIEKRFPNDIRNIDLYMKVLRYAQKTKKNMLVLNFAKKIIELQKRHKIKSYTPKIEIIYVHTLQKIGRYEEALREVLKLLTEKLSDKQKAEVLYLAGEISVSLKKPENAKKFFLKCGEIVKDSSWQRLCAQNLELLTQ